jgi:hypothetical protein
LLLLLTVGGLMPISTKQRVLPNVDTQLTHPDDIVEELESWVTAYAYIQNLSDIAQAHYHFEMIHLLRFFAWSTLEKNTPMVLD